MPEKFCECPPRILVGGVDIVDASNVVIDVGVVLAAFNVFGVGIENLLILLLLLPKMICCCCKSELTL